jgi:hypothetical protein
MIWTLIFRFAILTLIMVSICGFILGYPIGIVLNIRSSLIEHHTKDQISGIVEGILVILYLLFYWMISIFASWLIIVVNWISRNWRLSCWRTYIIIKKSIDYSDYSYLDNQNNQNTGIDKILYLRYLFQNGIVNLDDDSQSIFFDKDISINRNK